MARENKNIRSHYDEEREEMLLLLQAEQAEDIEKATANLRKITQAAIAQWVRDFKAGNIKLTTVEDLKKLIELEMYLLKNDEI
ncbi:hypothetical protein [Bacillus pumilus]|uniref:Uncharacterized protein n=1 Tax=Bacillus pumilus TaxID=1408 RepID=A0A2G8IXY6_BACPU|nr:hypothetical protein [Bacillus pumilus]KIL23733.1 hypothetical protein B4127_2666 [Bacillus pumilus]MBU8576006.1 hypothetical protein [Bacillus pumilus]MCY7575915.1 hypothetical protein [Bacillus pumilus]PIK28367.1 hypothetical protein CTV99_03365 [Bacillus pumilus]